MPGNRQPPAAAVAAASELKRVSFQKPPGTSTDVCVPSGSALVVLSLTVLCAQAQTKESNLQSRMCILQPPKMVSGQVLLLSDSSPHTQRISEWTASKVKSNGLFEGEADGREVSHSNAPRDAIKSSSQRYAVPERSKTHKILVTVGGF